MPNNNQSLTTLRLLAASRDSAALQRAEAEHLAFWTSQVQVEGAKRERVLAGSGSPGGGYGKCAMAAAAWAPKGWVLE